MDASQHFCPPLSSGRDPSQQKLPGLHSRTASFPTAVLSGDRQHGTSLHGGRWLAAYYVCRYRGILENSTSCPCRCIDRSSLELKDNRGRSLGTPTLMDSIPLRFPSRKGCHSPSKGHRWDSSTEQTLWIRKSRGAAPRDRCSRQSILVCNRHESRRPAGEESDGDGIGFVSRRICSATRNRRPAGGPGASCPGDCPGTPGTNGNPITQRDAGMSRNNINRHSPFALIGQLVWPSTGGSHFSRPNARHEQ